MTSTRTLTPTAALIIAGGLAAGIALARPAAGPDPAGAAQAAAAVAAQSVTPGQPAGSAEQAGGAGYRAPADGAGTGSAPDQAPGPAVLTIAGFDFGQPLTVAPGQVVAVDNADGAPHTVTFDDTSIDTGPIDAGSGSSFVAPSTPGTYSFFCTIHPTMRGQLVVQ